MRKLASRVIMLILLVSALTIGASAADKYDCTVTGPLIETKVEHTYVSGVSSPHTLQISHNCKAVGRVINFNTRVSENFLRYSSYVNTSFYTTNTNTILSSQLLGVNTTGYTTYRKTIEVATYDSSSNVIRYRCNNVGCSYSTSPTAHLYTKTGTEKSEVSYSIPVFTPISSLLIKNGMTTNTTLKPSSSGTITIDGGTYSGAPAT